jgi:predicted kinase
MNCIKSVKDYCISNNQPIAGQVIYMDRGVSYFGLLKEYLVNELGYREDEVGIIKSGLPKTGVRSKEYVKNLFNGEIYNEKSQTFEVVDDFKRLKVVIGSSTIKEGMNLQKYGAVLYNCFIDWNPTDIQQLEGRIYRQKNTYDAVRIVNPLVVDSADVFLFQKLQEKTARLNTIWSTDGHSNVLNTEEFNPEELKYALIKDPKVIAELRVIEELAKLDSDILGLKRQLEIIDKISSSAYTVNNYYKKVLQTIEEYRDFVPTNDLLTDATKLVQVVNALEKSQTDKEGKKIYDYYDKRDLKPEELEKASPLEDTYDKPYYFSDFSVSVRDINKYINEFIKQYNIEFQIENYTTSLNFFKNDIQKRIEDFESKKEFLKSVENKNILIEEAIAEKERQQINYKTIPQLVTDFGKLNYLLDKKVIANKKELPKYNTCPPMEADGKTRAISKDALDYLNKCLEKEPQTKDLHFDEKTGYTKERVKLHNEIINNLFEGVKCVKSDRQPIAIFTGGSPASGKSTFLEKNAKYLLSKDIFHLDADEIRSKLPEYKGWNANSTQLETTDIVNDILNKIGSEGCRYDFVYDGTMNRAKKYFDLINKAKSLGYKTYIIFMDISYGEAKKRVLERYRDRGRYVPVEVIDDFFTKVGDKSKGEDSLNQLKPMVDGYVVADGITGKIIDEGGEGLPDTREKDVYGEPLLKAETKKVKQPSKSDVKDTIDALQFLADAGNTDAKDTIESLKFLL